MNISILSSTKVSQLIAILLAAFLFTNVSAQQTAVKPKIFVAPTYDGFHNFISAALLENEVPVLVTTDDAVADFVIVVSSAKGNNKWYDTWFGTEKDRNQGSMKVIRVSDRAVVWASASGDKSFWWGGLKDMGQEKVANRLARKLRGDIKQLSAGAPAAFDESAKASNVASILGTEANVPKANVSVPSPRTAAEYSQLGIQAFEKQTYVNAELAFREAIKLAPNVAAHHFNLATALNARGRLDGAETEAEAAVRLDPSQPLYKTGLEAIRANKAPRLFQSADPTAVAAPSASSAEPSGNKTVQVEGYTKADGTQVAPYNRSAPSKKN